MSRLLVQFVLIILMSFRFVASADCQESEIARQEISVTLMPSDHILIGVSTITFAAGTRNVTLRLSPTATIESVSISGAKIPFSFSAGALSMDIPKTADQGAIVITVAYRAVFNDPLPLSSGSSEDPTYGVNGSITTHGTFLGYGAGWYPATSSTPLKRTVRITAPSGTEALTAGKRMSRGTVDTVSYSSWEELRPVGGLTLCAGPYLIEERRVDGVDIYTYLYQDNASLASRYLDAAARYIKFYSDLFGPYPFEKFAVVENFIPTGYGFSSFTLLGSSIIRLPFIVDTSLPHEIAHSWWGNAIQVYQNDGNWSEGLVTYLADYLLKERSSAAEGRGYRMKLLADYSGLVSPDNDFPLSSFTSRVDPATRAIGYGKGAMVFHMIRTEIGDRAFFGTLSDVCRERIYQSASWNDFERAFSKSSGRNLSSFMNQWLSRPGGPRLTLSNVTRRREGQGWTVYGNVVQTSPYYELQLPLRLETNGPPVLKLLPVTNAVTPFSINSLAEPGSLLLDPDAEVFRMLAQSEIPVTVNSIKASKHLIAIRTEDCRANNETFRRLLESLGQSGVSIIREDEINASQLYGHDLMFCGSPKQRSLLPPLPAGITMKGPEFSVHDNDIQSPDGLLFLVQQLPSQSGLVALFHPLSEAAAKQYALKITHYGAYGYLIFTGGMLRYKDTFQPSDRESAVKF